MMKTWPMQLGEYKMIYYMIYHIERSHHFDLMKEHAARGEDNELYPVVFTSMLGLDEYADEESPFDVNSYSRSSTPQVLLDHQLIPTSDGVMLCWDSVDDAFEGNILDKMFCILS